MLLSAANALEQRFDRLRFEAKRRLGLLNPFEILPYRGHGTKSELFLKGRVLEKSGITRSAQDDNWWDNLRNMARRFASDEVPGAVVRATSGELAIDTVADQEGFFEVRIGANEEAKGASSWRQIRLELLRPASPGGGVVVSTGQVLVPEEAGFGVISDLDDTVVHSSATNVLRMAWTVVLNNAYTRLPFDGVDAFYGALQRGAGTGRNPIFYVSSSPWNIYDMLEDFLDVHGVPAGPLFLKDWSPTVLGKHGAHKLGIIRDLLRTYPDLPFVLIGDSGEEDPEIYLQAIREHPGRITAVYIRDVTAGKRDRDVRDIADESRSLGTEVVSVRDTVAAAEHAASIGLIGAEAVEEVRRRTSSA